MVCLLNRQCLLCEEFWGYVMKNDLLRSIRTISDVLKHKAKNDKDINKAVLHYANHLIALTKELDASMFYSKDLDEIINLSEIHLSWDEDQIKN